MSDTSRRGNFVIVHEAIVQHPDLGLSAAYCYGILQQLAQFNEVVFASNSYLASRLGIGVTKLKEILRSLEAATLIKTRLYKDPSNPMIQKRDIHVFDLVAEKLKKSLLKSKNDPRGVGIRPQGSRNPTPYIYKYIIDKKEDPPLGDVRKPDKPAPKKADKPPPSSKNKKRYIDHVFMTEDEHGKLLHNYGEAKTNHFIQKLDAYVGSKNKKYSSHYKTIINWILKEEAPPTSTPPAKPKASGVTQYPQWLKDKSEEEFNE